MLTSIPVMSRYFIHMAYDGRAYCGWQIQAEQNTVQQVLEHSLSTLMKREVAVTGAGRTDTGVHASHFVAHFDLDETSLTGTNVSGDTQVLLTEKFLFKLNRFLPEDIVVYRIHQVQKDMHARFSAIYRTYHYHISSIKPLYNRDYTHYVYGKLNLEAIEHCCKVILDIRDFTSFAKLHSDVKTHICQVSHARWKVINNGYRFEITADRFLRNMVRALTGTLLDVGLGKIDPDDFKMIVAARDRSKAGASVPAKALFLVDIGYPEMAD